LGFIASRVAASGALLLLEELGCCCAVTGIADALRNNEAATHSGKIAGCREKDDLAGKGTIGIRRSHKV
jgi:hypothetical protein